MIPTIPTELAAFFGLVLSESYLAHTTVVPGSNPSKPAKFSLGLGTYCRIS